MKDKEKEIEIDEASEEESEWHMVKGKKNSIGKELGKKRKFKNIMVRENKTALNVNSMKNMKRRINIVYRFAAVDAQIIVLEDIGLLMEKERVQAARLWNGTVIWNIANKCSVIMPPEKSTMTCLHLFEDFSYSSTCSFTCTEGFKLSGSERLQCLASGMWNHQPPSCEAQKCSHLLSPEKGFMYCLHWFEDLSYNSTCDFSCMEGFLLNGSERLRCTVSGKWTSEAPTCRVQKCNMITSPEMGAMTCNHPIGAFSYNSTCNFTCGEGFIRRGPERLQCLASGMWSHQPPDCKGNAYSA
ncbi:P-selectin-like [Protopterus annectens]|uniref:P-selectin-like n=1 Tax=Protopterus annectens TaxID=7888 RepID=UPI001CFAE86A|nr:P-selectin-like [Protopterus annectens]